MADGRPIEPWAAITNAPQSWLSESRASVPGVTRVATWPRSVGCGKSCQPIAVDKTLARVQWKGANDLSALAGKPVRFRFHLREGSLYAFWVGPDASGASHGYVAAGGPGLSGPIDTVGVKGYEKAP